uniref:J domain-containing protein n=1 Tax=Spongospora subterranea TaxID=70186 RepID=A0A0H5R0P6_9EUKA|eukprot:CRZ01339.1 hypothetical protein [Spongospora subterranea]
MPITFVSMRVLVKDDGSDLDASSEEKQEDAPIPIHKEEEKLPPTMQGKPSELLFSSSGSKAKEPSSSKTGSVETIDLLFGFDSSAPSSSFSPVDISFQNVVHSNPSSVSPIDDLFTSPGNTDAAISPFVFGHDSAVANAFLYSSTPNSSSADISETERNARVRTLHAQINADEQMQDAKERVKDNISFQLDNWELGIGQKRKPIRVLLSTMHTILPSDMNVPVVKLSDIVSASDVKRTTRRTMLLVHPDKVDRTSAEKLVICERVFNAIQVEYKAFEESGAL